MILRSLTSIFLILLALNTLAQEDNREIVFVHLNTNTLISGETLYYSTYCRSELTEKSSPLSKILYLEIIGEKGVIHQEKIFLENGRGHGEFFINSLIPAGKYHLLAYTRWMKNFNNYFRTHLEIINPFETTVLHEEKNKKLEVDFYITDNSLIANINNTIGFRINSESLKYQRYKGRIVSRSGETVAEFTHDSFGLGMFSLVPVIGENYNMVLEDKNGKLQFFKLHNSIVSGTSIEFVSRSKNLEVKIHNSDSNNEFGTLVIRDGLTELINRRISLNSSTNIDLTDYQGKMLAVEVNNTKNETLAARSFLMPILQSSQIDLESIYKVRTKVTPSLKLEPGTYSVSVRKTNEFLNSAHSNSLNNSWVAQLETSPIEPDEYYSTLPSISYEPFLLGSKLKSVVQSFAVSKLPEFRDEFIDGKVIDDSGRPVSEAIIALTVLSDPYQIRATTTDSAGIFSIPFEFTLQETDGFLTSTSLDSMHNIITTTSFLTEYPELKFNFPPLDSNQIKEVVEKSIRIQIENAYYVQDSLNVHNFPIYPQIEFYREYVLDEYERFQTLRETIIEYIPEASVRERRSPKIKPHFTTLPENIKYPPLLLLDGVPVAADNILAFGANNIEKISLLNNRFFLGPLVSDGIVSFKTFEGKLQHFSPSKYHHRVLIKGLTYGKIYKFSEYIENRSNRRPDQRDQLYWNPNYTVRTENGKILEFYTSDVPGQFEIIIEGFQQDGQPVSFVKTFLVH